MIRKIKKTAIVIGVLLVGLLVWGLSEPYFINIEREIASVPNLPESWEGKEIAVLGDFQLGMWMGNESTVDRAIEKIVEMEPSAVLLLGDYVYHSVNSRKEELKKVVKFLRPLAESNIPTFALLGNHDYGMKHKSSKPNIEYAQLVTDSLEEIGTKVLKNESVPLQITENGVVVGTDSPDTLYLVGIGASWPNNVNVSQALIEIPNSAPRIAMMHNPEAFEKFPSNSSPVAVAGHTHGGQLGIPFTPDWSYRTLAIEGEAHAYGWIDGYGASGNELYVNAGMGLSTLPLRINRPPEITVFELKQK